MERTLKNDLLQKLKDEKYFEEVEFARLATIPNMNYREKLTQIQEVIKNIAILNAQIELTNYYIVDTNVPEASTPQEVVETQESSMNDDDNILFEESHKE